VEETVYSGETLPLIEQIHTPFVGEVVNQLVLVPESSFEEERKAIEAAAKLWNVFIRCFSESRPIGPGDPVEFLDRSIRAMLVRAPSTATLATTIGQRVEFAIREAPELWEEVLKGSTEELEIRTSAEETGN